MLNLFLSSCRASADSCLVDESDADAQAQCIDALVNVRGTALEQQCYCAQSDRECAHYQTMMLPKNPCVGERPAPDRSSSRRAQSSRVHL